MKKTKTNKSSDHDLLNDLSGHERLLESDTTGLFRRFRWLLAGGIAIAVILVIWSYLNFLCATHVASSNDSANWLLSLFYGDRCNRQSGISNLPNAGTDNDGQQLSLNGTTINLTNGGNVDLSFLTGTPGPAGANGNNGTNGVNGTSGANGATGATGPAGPAGPGTTVPNCLPTEVVFANGTTFSCVPIPAATVLSAQNGTSLVGTAVELGLNPLLHNTTIPQGAFDLTLDGTGGGSFYQNSVNGGTGNSHGITSGDNILSLPFSGTVMYSSPNPAAIGGGGEGSFMYTLDGQAGLGVQDGLGEVSQAGFNPTGFGISHAGAIGNSNISGGANNVALGGFDNATSSVANVDVGGSPGVVSFFGNGGIPGQIASGVFDAPNSDVFILTNNPTSGIGQFHINGSVNTSEWLMQDGVAGITSVFMDSNAGFTNFYNQAAGGFNNFTLNNASGITFASNIPPVFAPNIFSVSNNGDVSFDRELRPGGNAGNAGEVLVSQGLGLPPIWSAAAGGGITTINAQTGPAITLNSTGPISTTTLANTVTFGLTPCAINQNYVYSGATWICQNAVLNAQNGTSLVGNSVELGLNPLLHATNISLANQDFTIEGTGGSIGHGLGIGTSGTGARLNLNSWGGGFPNGFGAALKLTDASGFPAAYFADLSNAGFLINTNNDAAFHVMMVGPGGSTQQYTLNSDQLGRVYIDQSGPTTSPVNSHLYVRGLAGMSTTSFQTNGTNNITEWGNVFNTAISVVDSVGHLGIGNSAPVTAIHAGNNTLPIGSATVSIRSEDSAGYCEIQGSNGMNCVSDARLKTNIVTLNGSLDKIMQLNGVHYNWKVSPNDNLQTGFIAQDVEAIFPELVKTDTATGLKSVNYDRFTPYIVQAMKEQQTQISSLKTIVGVTDTPTDPSSPSEFTSLAARLDALEAKNTATTTSTTTTNTQSVATAVFNGGVVTGDVEFQGTATFLAATTFKGTTVFEGDATFNGDVKVNGNLAVSDNTAGSVTIPAGQTSATISFAKPHAVKPVISVTPGSAVEGNYFRSNVTTSGFTIKLVQPQPTATTFDWTAFEK